MQSKFPLATMPMTARPWWPTRCGAESALVVPGPLELLDGPQEVFVAQLPTVAVQSADHLELEVREVIATPDSFLARPSKPGKSPDFEHGALGMRFLRLGFG